MSRVRLPVIFGGGLDRATGVEAIERGRFADLRNFWPRDEKLALRGGMQPPADALNMADVTDVVGIFPFEAEQAAVLVGWNRTTRDLTVWLADSVGGNAALIGTWDTTGDDAVPRVTAAESYGKLFLAHEREEYNFRLHTVYFDPELVIGAQLVTLEADLDGSGTPAPVKFRGVKRHLDYLFGFGYGTDADANRPEVVRVSKPGEPTLFDKNHYLLAGARGDPVVALEPLGEELLVLKRGRAYTVTGSDQSTFGIKPREEVFGVVATRAAIVVGSEVFYWSEYGPRMIAAGSASQDLAGPLELDGPSPTDLAAAGENRDAFAFYEPAERAVCWAFPVLDPAGETTRVYALSLRNPSKPRWAYVELTGAVACAGLLTESSVLFTAVTAYATDVTLTDQGSVTDGQRTVRVAHTNNLHAGNETIEVFRRVAGGAWALFHSYAATGDPTQYVDLPGWQALDSYEVAIRYTRDGRATSGYSAADPDLWGAETAAGARAEIDVPCSVPVLTAAAWDRNGLGVGEITAAWTLAETGVTFELEDAADPAGPFAVVTTAAALATGVVYEPPSGQYGTSRSFRVLAKRGSTRSTASNVVTTLLGVDAVPELDLVAQLGSGNTLLLFIGRVPGTITRMQVQTGTTSAGPWTTRYDSTTGTTEAQEDANYPRQVTGEGLGLTTHVRARLGTANDWGAWATANVALTSVAGPTARAGVGVFTDYGNNGVGMDSSVSQTARTSGAGGGERAYLTYYDKLVGWSLVLRAAPGSAHPLTLTVDGWNEDWHTEAAADYPPSTKAWLYMVDAGGTKLATGQYAGVEAAPGSCLITSVVQPDPEAATLTVTFAPGALPEGASSITAELLWKMPGDPTYVAVPGDMTFPVVDGETINLRCRALVVIDGVTYKGGIYDTDYTFTIVEPPPPVTHLIVVNVADPFGSVSGGGEYADGAAVAVSATPDEGYDFTHWSEGGVEVSTANPYNFFATADRTLVAHFVSNGEGL